MSLLITHVVLFAVAFTAATIVPGSSELALAASIAANPGYTVTLFLTALAGNVLGSVLNWALGRWAAGLTGKKGFPITLQQLARASALFNRYGYWLLDLCGSTSGSFFLGSHRKSRSLLDGHRWR